MAFKLPRISQNSNNQLRTNNHTEVLFKTVLQRRVIYAVQQSGD